MRPRKLTPIFLEGIFGLGASRRFFKNFPYHFDRVQDFENLSRYSHFKFLILLVAVVIFIRLFQLTVIEGKKYRELAESNRIRYVQQEAPRGRVLDRRGEVIASSATKFFLENGNSNVQISEQQAAELEGKDIAGENFVGELGRIRRETVRIYPFGQEIVHVLGYVSQVSPQDLQKDKNLSNLDFVGRLGVEETYDGVLRGENGARIVEVDAVGNIISILGEKEAVGGQDIKLALDLGLQRKVFATLGAQIKKVRTFAGAAIVTDVNSGEILAMVSYPTFAPDSVSQAVVDAEKPLFNRAISGTYPPGSVFKPVSAIAGLTSGKINKETEIEDVGEFSIGDVKFSNWYFANYGRRDGQVKIDRAIGRSNDIFFYRLGEKVGLGVLREAAIKLGFGKKTGVDLPNESFGLVPDELWKQSTLGQSWFLGDTMHMAIGQGFVLATPLQVNNLTNVIASGGKLYRPHLVLGVKRNGREEIIIAEDSGKTVVDDTVLLPVREGMRMACEKGGTAWPFFTAPYKVGCKTGTAEKLQGNPHAWFTAFAPYENPKIAITVIIENGGEGSSVAAPVAREVLDWYFQR